MKKTVIQTKISICPFIKLIKFKMLPLIEKGMKIYDNYKKGLNVAIFENDKNFKEFKSNINYSSIGQKESLLYIIKDISEDYFEKRFIKKESKLIKNLLKLKSKIISDKFTDCLDSSIKYQKFLILDKEEEEKLDDDERLSELMLTKKIIKRIIKANYFKSFDYKIKNEKFRLITQCGQGILNRLIKKIKE